VAAPGKLEGAFNPDRSADPLSWDWVDLSALTALNNVTITRGRSSSRTGIADPSSATFPLRNGGGDTGVTLGSLTPRKATGDWYPGIGRGMVLRPQRQRRRLLARRRRHLHITGVHTRRGVARHHR
jgi:hypothetical protein